MSVESLQPRPAAIQHFSNGGYPHPYDQLRPPEIRISPSSVSPPLVLSPPPRPSPYSNTLSDIPKTPVVSRASPKTERIEDANSRRASSFGGCRDDDSASDVGESRNDQPTMQSSPGRLNVVNQEIRPSSLVSEKETGRSSSGEWKYRHDDDDDDDLKGDDRSDIGNDQYRSYDRYRNDKFFAARPYEERFFEKRSPTDDCREAEFQRRSPFAIGQSAYETPYEPPPRIYTNVISKYQKELKFETKSPSNGGGFDHRQSTSNEEDWRNLSPSESNRPGFSDNGRTNNQLAPYKDRVSDDFKYSLDSKSYDTTPLAAMMQRFAQPGASESFHNSSNTRFSGVGPRSAYDSAGLGGGDIPLRYNSQNLLSPVQAGGRSEHFAPMGGSVSLMSGGVQGAGGDGQFYCHICTFVGTTELGFKEHLKGHFEHRCPHCTYSSRTEGRLQRHIAGFHGDKVPDQGLVASRKQEASGGGGGGGKPKLLKCRQCRYATTVKEEFWAHSRLHIKKEKQLSCPRCEFVTEFKHHLEYHIRNHVGSKPYKCSKCTYTCVNKSMLNSHMKSHTNIYR